MTIPVTLHDTRTLLGVMRDLRPVSSYWLDLCFPNQINSDKETIDFEKVTDKRKLAPFVAPTAQGRPIYDKASAVQTFKPAYVKPKDAVSPTRMLKKQPGELAVMTEVSAGARMNAILADIAQDHIDAIRRRWEWQAAEAIIKGEVTIEDEDSPTRTVIFGRDPGHDVTLVGPALWSAGTADIIGDIEAWRTTVRQAKFGGPTDRLTVTPDVWDVMRKNPDLLKQLDTQIRGTQGMFITGVREGEDVEFVGRLSNSLDVYVYNDYYEDSDGNVVNFMEPGQVVLTGRQVNGVRAFGAILDADAGLVPMEVFPKMYKENDPSAVFMMTQSSPLMIPVNPNNTLRATVL